MNVKVSLAPLLALVLTGCASIPQQQAYRTPSGLALGATIDQVRTKVLQACSNSGGVIETNNQMSLICSRPMPSTMGAFFWRALATPRYATNPDLKVRYNMSPTESGVYLSIDMYAQYQTAFGQTTTIPIQNAQLAAAAQGWIDRLSTEHPR